MRLARAIAAAVLLALPGGAAADEPEPDEVDPALVLASVDGDPDGEATRADRAALGLLLGGRAPVGGGARSAPDPVAAARAWMRLAEADPDAAIDLPGDLAPLASAPLRGTRWRAREVALLRLAHLPPAGLAEVEARWGGRAAAALDHAIARADPVALRRVGEEVPVVSGGRRALLLSADVALERGDAPDAAALLARWLRLSPREPVGSRAAALVRLLDALGRFGDDRSIDDALAEFADAADVPVRRGDRPPATARAATAAARVAARERIARGAPPVPPEAPLPPRHRVLWSRVVRDPDLLRAGWRRDPSLAPTSVVASGSDLFTCEERVVRRLDLETGAVRWTYPASEGGTDIAAEVRYRTWEMPVRAVEVAGPLVLAVLGDPPMPETSSFSFLGRDYPAWAYARECRARLLALDRETGAVRWASGAPDERHPVVGAPDVACVSPPLADGDSVWAVFGARRGRVSLWLCRLDLATGRVRSATFLGAGESGLATDREEPRRLVEREVRSVPAAQRPALGDGEIVVATQAGFAAGVDPRDGRLRWSRALPRYGDVWATEAAPAPPGPEETHSPRNAPLATFGRWFLAPVDCPALVALEAGTGRLLWTDSLQPSSPSTPVSRVHLLDAFGDRGGLGWVGVAGDGLHAFSALDGRLRSEVAAPPETDDDEPSPPVGRPWVEPGLVVRVDPGARGGPGLAASRWLPSRRADGADVARSRAEPPLPRYADLVRAGRVWVAVGTDRLVAFAAPADAAAIADAPPRDAADAARRACLRAALDPSLASFDAAAAAVRRAGGAASDALAQAGEALLVGESGLLAGDAPARALEALPSIDVLPPDLRGTLYLRLGDGLLRRGLDAEAVDLAFRWMAWGEAGLVDPEGRGSARVRGDLHAGAALLPAAAATPEGLAALARHEAVAAEDLAAAGDDPSLLEALVARRRGTEAAWFATLRLAAAALDGGRPGDAAAALSDARLSGPAASPLGDAVVASLRAAEGDLLGRAGEPDAARTALFDADRLRCAAARTVDGGPASALEEALGSLQAIVPANAATESLPLWDEPPSSDVVGGTAVLEPTGPGARAAAEDALVASGVDLFGWTPATGARRPVAPRDAGWLGANLREREPGLPGPGVLVGYAVPGEPADRAGLAAGDWILSWDGTPLEDATTLNRLVAQSSAGRPVALVTRRFGRPGPASVVPGVRPPSQPAPFLPRSAYVLRDGSFVVATRYGLRRVDPTTGSARDLWRWDGPGAIEASRGFAGTVLVSIRLRRGDDAVAAVDAESGRERWRARIRGAIDAEVRVEGSSVVVDAVDPPWTWILDGATGSVRAAYATPDPIRLSDVPLTTLPAPRSASAAGVVYLVAESPGEESKSLVAVAGTTGTKTFSEPLRANAGDDYLLPAPPVAAGGLVVVASSSADLRFHVPDLRGGCTRGVTLSSSPSASWRGARRGITEDGRLFVSGDVAYVVRVDGSFRPSLFALALDRAAAFDPLSTRSTHERRSEQPLVPVETAVPNAWGSSYPRVAAARATREGIWVLAVRSGWGSDPKGAVVGWVSSEPDDACPPPVLLPVPLTTEPLQGFVRLGRRMLVPTDEGVLSIPLR